MVGLHRFAIRSGLPVGVGTDGRNPPVPAAPTGRATPLPARPDQQGTTNGVQPDEGLDRPGHPRFRAHLLRPPPRTGHSLHDRDVGAFLLLRHEGSAPAVPGRTGWPAPERGHRDRDLLRLRVDGVPARPARRLVRRPGLGSPQDRRRRRRSHHARPPDAGAAVVGHLLRGPRPRGDRLGSAEGQHLHDGRPPLRRPGRPAPRRWLHGLLHGHQPRRLRRAADHRHHR